MMKFRGIILDIPCGLWNPLVEWVVASYDGRNELQVQEVYSVHGWFGSKVNDTAQV